MGPRKGTKELIKEFKGLDPSDINSYIEFFEKNEVPINLIDANKGVNQLDTKLKLIIEYGFSLLYKGELLKSFKQFEHAFHVLDQSEYSENERHKEIENLEFRLFSYAVSSYETKDFKRSFKIFKHLIKLFPENEKYQAWLTEIKVKPISKFIRPLFAIIMIWFIGDLTFFNYFNSSSRFLLTLIGSPFLIAYFAFELYTFFVKKRKIKYSQI